jgi:hypothetical protein
MLNSQSCVRIKDISTLNDGEYARIEDGRVTKGNKREEVRKDLDEGPSHYIYSKVCRLGNPFPLQLGIEPALIRTLVV